MRAAATLTAVALALAGTLAGIQLATSGHAGADEITVSQNASRDGWDSSEPMLSPATVTGKSFGQIFDTPVNGQVFAQPLNVGNSVLVATENDYVYSINRNTGAVNWSRQLGSPYAAATENCKQAPVVLPYIGVTSAPVYDPASGTLYVSGMLSGPPGDDTDMGTANPTYWLFALDEKTGAVEWKQQIKGSPANNSGNKFAAAKQMQRTGLLLLNGSVYMGFGALCADGAANHNYVGYIVRVNTTKGHAETLWSDQAADPSMTGIYGGIWQGGGGLVSDGHSVYFSTGNGTPPGLGVAGKANTANVLHLGQSMVKLNVAGTGPMQATDFFSPGDAATMNASDHDFGSGGPILLPFTTTAYPGGLFATADKEAVIYLLDKDNLGGSSSSATDSTAVYTSSQDLVNDPSGNVVAHGLWGHMAAAAFSGTGADGLPNDYLYYEGTGWGSQDNMYALKFDGSVPSKPVLHNVGASAKLYGFSSGSPVITSNGTDPNSAIVWEVHADDNTTGGHGSLDAYSALPVNGVLNQIWSAPIGSAAQFTIPATSNGRVYVGARNDASAANTGTNAGVCPTDFESSAYAGTDSACVGDVYGFGTFSAQLAGSTVNLGKVALGKTVTRRVTLTNTGDTPVTIISVTTPSVPFGTPAGGPVLNQPIARGASVSFPVTFTPQARGTTTGKYTVTTMDGFTAPHTTTVTVTGTGAAPAAGVTFVPSPGGGWTLNGHAAMVGTTLRLTSAANNTSGSAVYYQRLTSNGLKATFTARLSGGTGADGLTFALLDPTKSTVSSLGTGGGYLGFGGLSGVAVVLGTHKDTGDPSGNFIGIATGTANGHLAFAATSTKVPNLRSAMHVIGVTVSGGKMSVTVDGKQYLSAQVKLPKSVLAAFTGACGGLNDVHAVSGVAITPPGSGGRLPTPGGGWSFNGTAAMTGSATALTRAVANQAGAVLYPHAVSTASFRATFNVALGGGTGGEGMTLALLNTGSKWSSVGGSGQGLGFAGLNGLAVVLGTQQVPGAPSANFAGIEKGTAGGTPSFVATTALPAPNLRAGTHTVTVTLKSGTLTVTIDGSTVLTHAVKVPSSAFVAYTGSTGTLTDQHLVQYAAISAG